MARFGEVLPRREVIPGSAPVAALSRRSQALACMAGELTAVVVALALVELAFASLAPEHWSAKPVAPGAAVFLALLFVMLQGLGGAHRAESHLDARASLRVSVPSIAVAGLMLAGLIWQETGPDRGLAVLVPVSTIALGTFVLGARWLASIGLRGALGRGNLVLRRAYLVGVGAAEPLAELSHAMSRSGVRTVAARELPLTGPGEGQLADHCSRIADEIAHHLRGRNFDEVHVFASWERQAAVLEMAAALRRLPLPVLLFSDGDVARLLPAPPLRIGRYAGLEIQRAPLAPADLAMKRATDVVLAGAALAMLAPVMMLTALAIVLTSGRPVLFRQVRGGLYGRPFAIVKFRTMQACEDGHEVRQATRNDPRVTALGALLRRTSIDELPQLINVLKGEMSLVGPRPHALVHDRQYTELVPSYPYRQHVKPGITGLAQVSGLRGETRATDDMRRRVELDLRYIDDWSLALDLRILAVTAARLPFDRSAW